MARETESVSDEDITSDGQPYTDVDWELNYREHQDEYVIGRGEFGVLRYEPYKSEILPHWEYKDEAAAARGGEAIFQLFEEYLDAGEFPGADMARKFLRMGFTRAMRYAKYPGGKKYNDDGTERDAQQWADPDKRAAAVVYKKYWDRARAHPKYKRMKENHQRDDEKIQVGLTEITT